MRVGVGGPGHRAGVWRVWANQKTSDVYVQSREVGGQKYSFHQSGDWRHAWNTAELAEEFTGQPRRLLDQWQRPEPDAFGWIRAFTIWVPSEDVIDVPDDRQRRQDVQWIAQPPPGDIVGIHVVIIDPDHGQVEINLVPVNGFMLANGQCAMVFANHFTPEGTGAINLVDGRRRAAEVMRLSGAEAIAPRVILHATEDESGVRVLYDLAGRSCAREGCPPLPADK